MEFKKIVIIGAGTMGHGIGQTYASFGYDTTIIDINESSIEMAKKLVKVNIETMLAADFITQEQAKATEENLRYTTDMKAAADADLVVEAAPEDPDIKAVVFRQLDEICRKDAVLSTTTSSMNLYDEMSFVSNPERLLIIHWCNPPHIVPLVEIVAGADTKPGLVEAIRKQLDDLGKTPVVLNQFVPGFIVNRLNLALMRECSYMVEQGWISAEDVDAAFSCNQGMKAPFEGPLEMVDYIGWDIGYAAGMILYDEISSSTDPSNLALQLLNEGRLGLKSGRGIYDYSGKTREEVQKARDSRVLEVVKLARRLRAEKNT